MQNLSMRVCVVFAVLVLISCRVKIEPKLTMTQVLSNESVLVPAFVTVETETCTTEDPKKYFLGVVGTFEGCRRKGNTFVKEWRTDIPLVQSADIETLKSTPIALFRGKKGTLITFLKQDVISGFRKEMFKKNQNNLGLIVRYEIANDTKLDVTLAVSSVWVNDDLAVGQQLTAFTVPAEGYITVTLSDTGVSALLRTGTEPVSIVPFDER